MWPAHVIDDAWFSPLDWPDLSSFLSQVNEARIIRASSDGSEKLVLGVGRCLHPSRIVHIHPMHLTGEEVLSRSQTVVTKRN